MQINGIHLNAFGDKITVSVEISGAWVTVITEPYDGSRHISRVVDPESIEAAYKKAVSIVRHHEEPQQD